MIRTQISLPKGEYETAKREAKALGISLAEYFRRALLHALPIQKGNPWMRYAGFIESSDTRSSRSIDEVVYGSKS